MNIQRCNWCTRLGVSCTLLRAPTAVRCAQCASNSKRCSFVDENRIHNVASTTSTSCAGRGEKSITGPTSSIDILTHSKTRLVIRIPPRRSITTVAAVQHEIGARPQVSLSLQPWTGSHRLTPLFCIVESIYAARGTRFGSC